MTEDLATPLFEIDPAYIAGADAHYSSDGARISLIHFRTGPQRDRVFVRDDIYWFDLCLTPRAEGIRAGFADYWGPHRFEPLGEVFFLPPGVQMTVRGEEPTEQSSLVCELDRALVDRWMGGEAQWTDRRLEGAVDMKCPPVRLALARLAQEIRSPGTGSDVLIDALLAQLAIETARYCDAIADVPIAGGLASWRLRLIDERLAELSAPPTLEELARLCNMSVRQLTRGWRASRGGSIGDAVMQQRIETAKRMLASERSIKEVAFAVGFASPSAFSAAFRKAAFLTPSHFRQRVLRSRDT